MCAYVTNRAGSSDMFPASYHRHVSCETGQADLAGTAGDVVGVVTGAEPVVGIVSDEAFGMELVATSIAATFKQQSKGSSGVGAERALLVASPFNGGEIYLVCSDQSVVTLNVPPTHMQLRNELNMWLGEQTGVNILEGDITSQKTFHWVKPIALNGSLLVDAADEGKGAASDSSDMLTTQSSRSLVAAWLLCSPLDDILFDGGWCIHT